MAPWLISLVAAVLAGFTVSGCSQARANQPAPPPAPQVTASLFPLTVADDAGRSVTISAQPRRILSLSASNTEMLFALGLEQSVVGVDQYSDYPPAAREKPSVGSFSKPDLEKILALEPDLIMGTEIHLKTVVPELESRGLQVMLWNPKGLEGVLDKIRLLGKVTGRQAQAEALVAAMESRAQSVAAGVKGAEPVRVFFELSPQLHTAGPGSYVDDLIRRAAGINIAAGAGKEWPQLNQESLFIADPEVILLGDHSAGAIPEQVAARPGWRQITAVKNGRVFAVDPNLTNRPGPRVAEGLELIARLLHPERAR